ncbi:MULTISPECIES: helix-turn-helix domain-containing protein [Chryseobacterium]|uniref:Helix-turn-helix domain-containing protein n=1 Tax=Chryseobacterium muglaense TaxID=2893752 RepID=A0ABR8MB86_9FLAO|nr:MULTISPECIES: helix-turn-helix domain-containing protein [Chryseobacterium]MBD3906757.1 helix-turn-helix domain-containing protein [Chryseobacterium muglaense]
MQKSDLNEIKKSIGKVIIDKKKQLQITNEEICTAVNIKVNTLNKIEQGMFSPGIDLLLLIFEILEINLKIDLELIN